TVHRHASIRERRVVAIGVAWHDEVALHRLVVVRPYNGELSDNRGTAVRMRPLTKEERADCEENLDLAAHLAGARRPLSAANLQELFDVLSEGDAPHRAVIALGYAFGELIVRRAGFEWARVSDEYGEETCVAPRGVEMYCSPLDMIQKRIEQK